MSGDGRAAAGQPAGFFAAPGHTVAALAARLRAGDLTAVSLAERALAAIGRLDERLGAFAAVDAEGALRAARQADEELAAGRDRGPLHGVPVAVKDVVPVAGLPFTMGSAHFAGHVAAADAACVSRLRTGGAVLLGTTRTHEFAYGPTGDRSASGPSRNPHDPARMSGGSSGGSAVAVAAGMVPLALGTDTGGSVRIPAALCGTAGFKPAYGAIPADGVFPLAASLDHVGVLARTAADCRLADLVLADPPGAPRDAPRPARVGWLAPEAFGPVDPEVARLARAAVGRAAEAGTVAAVEEAAFPDAPAASEAFTALQDAEVYAVHADRVAAHPERFDPEVLDRLRGAARTPGWRYVRALRERERLGRSVAALFARHDLLALPTTPLTAPELGARTARIAGREAQVRPALLSLTSPWNLLGLPALTVPAGAAAGLPTGLQLVCAPGREELLFAVAGATGADGADGGALP